MPARDGNWAVPGCLAYRAAAEMLCCFAGGARCVFFRLALAPVPALASISDVDFHGTGRVAFVDVTNLLLRPLALGTPVRITGSLALGPAAVPDRFTGNVVFDEAALFANQQD